MESGIGGLRSAASHQAEQADVKLPIETMKVSANIIEDVSSQYEHYTGKLSDRENCGVLRQGMKMRPSMKLMYVRQRKHWKIVRSGSINTKGCRISLTHKRRKRFAC